MESPVLSYLRQVHRDLEDLDDGTLSPLGDPRTVVNPDDFGIALVTVDGTVYEVGDTEKEFLLQSISKPFSYGLAFEDHGAAVVDTKVDVEPSGDAFGEISLNPETGRPANAMINAGALAVASMIKGSGGRSAVQRIVELYSTCAGRSLRIDGHAFQSELRNSDRNHALAYLLSSAGIIEQRPTTALETYLRQCSVQVNCRDLAMMAATLANGGTNPLTGNEALGLDAVERVLSVMMTSGMYDDAGDWAVSVGLPAKSGVGGGIVAVLPGQAGLAVYSPPLDRHGNSVRGVAACRKISRDMGMHFVRAARSGRSAIRSSVTVDVEPSTTRRTDAAVEVLEEHGHRAAVIELTGDLFFAGTESVMRELSGLADTVEMVIVDARDVDEVGRPASGMFAQVHAQLADSGRHLVLVDPDGILEDAVPENGATRFETRDRAISYCEDRLLDRYGTPESSPAVLPALESPMLGLLDDADIRAIAARMEPQSFEDGEVVRRIGQRFGGVYFVLSGTIGLTAVDADGSRFKISTLSAGMTFGDLALGDDDRQETTAKAEGAVQLMKLSAEAIEQLEHDDQRLAVQLWRALARDASFRMGLHARAAASRSQR